MSTTQSSTNSIACNAEIVSNGESKAKRRYDGRLQNGKHPNSRSKPRWAKHLSRNAAARLFVECNVRETLAQILSNPTHPEWSMWARYIWDRFEGKPFVAVNPEEQRKPSVLNDNRLQIAVQQLLPGATKQLKKRKPKLLAQQSSTDDAKSNDTNETVGSV